MTDPVTEQFLCKEFSNSEQGRHIRKLPSRWRLVARLLGLGRDERYEAGSSSAPSTRRQNSLTTVTRRSYCKPRDIARHLMSELNHESTPGRPSRGFPDAAAPAATPRPAADRRPTPRPP